MMPQLFRMLRPIALGRYVLLAFALEIKLRGDLVEHAIDEAAGLLVAVCLSPIEVAPAAGVVPRRIAPWASHGKTSSGCNLELGEQVAEFLFLGPQILDIAVMRRYLERHARDVHAVALEALELVRIVGQQAHFADSE